MMKVNIVNNSGYILPSVLIISLLVTLLIMGIISTIFFNHSLNQKMVNKSKLDLACFSVIQKFISEEKEFVEGSIYTKIDSIDVRLTINYNGLFTEVDAISHDGKDSSRVMYLLGNKLKSVFQNALIISKDNLRASVAGETKINGDMLLTSKKIKIGRISGIKSANKNYHKGEISVQENIGQKLFKESLLTNILNTDKYLENSTYIDGDYELNQTTLLDKGRNHCIQVGGNLELSENLKNNNKSNDLSIHVLGETNIRSETSSSVDLTIICDSAITFEKDVILENAILISTGKITVADNCLLKNVQLYSKKGIEISGSVFNYPSVIALYSDVDEESNLKNKIKIESSVINGSILLVNTTTGLPNNKNLIDIDSESRIQGLVYSENNAKIMGEVYGIVYTHSFWYYKEPTEYINWLVDLKVNRDELDDAFLLPMGLTETNDYAILKETWIN